MNGNSPRAFGPESTVRTLANIERELLRLGDCSAHATPHSQSTLDYHRDSDGRLIVRIQIENNQVTSIDLFNMLEVANADWLLSFLGWLMPERVGHNLHLRNNILSSAKQLNSDATAGNKDIHIDSNWHPENDSMGKVLFNLSRETIEAPIKMSIKYFGKQ